ncbi:MAG: primosomal protein N' [Candidatus Bathyarchaeota archaeon]|nr:primosomal protein N' [Candidatus Bathyarchaeota archaeon]
MYIIEVVPIAKIPLPSSQVLTYFTSQRPSDGSLVLVPLKKKEVPAIVLSQKRADEAKMEIKKAKFKLRPVLKVIEEKPIIFNYQIEVAKWISRYYWASLGKTMSLFLPTPLLKKLVKNNIRKQTLFELKNPVKKTIRRPSSKLYIAPFGSLPDKEIKITLKQKKQVLFLIPEKSRNVFWTKKIKQTISQEGQNFYNFCFFSTGLPSNKYLENFEKIKEDKVKIVIGTRSALFAPFVNLGLIVLLEAANKNYKSEMEPRYNAKKVAEKLVSILGINLVFVSSLPLIEDYVRSRKIDRIEQKVQKVEKKIIDMKSLQRISRANVLEQWSPLSPFLLNEIKKYISLKKKIVLFINRKGEGLSVVCQDCGWIKKCRNCEVPLILRRGGNQKNPSMICCHCGFESLPPQQCEKCQSWRLITLGSGIEKVEGEIRKSLKGLKVLRLDSETAPKRSTQNKIIKNFLGGEESVLIATSLIFRYFPTLLDKKMPLVGIISMDSLLSLPDFKNEEEGIKIVHNLLSLTSNKFIFQTFWPDSQVASFIRSGYNYFFKKVIDERKRLLYPPFSKIIKLTFSHRDIKKVQSKAYDLVERLKRQVTIFN